MSFSDYLRAVSRHRFVVIAAVLIGVAAGYLSAPSQKQGSGSYQATVTMVANPQASGSINLPQTRLFVTKGEVPRRVAASLGGTDDPATLAAQVEADSQRESQSLTVTATDPDRTRAALIADRFAAELNNVLVASEQAQRQAAIDAAAGRVVQLQTQISDLEEQLVGRRPDDPAVAQQQAELDAVKSNYASAQASYDDALAEASPQPPLTTLDAARAKPAQSTGFRAPSSKAARVGLLGLFGLVVGVGGAIVLDRLDTRLRSKAGTEEAFGVPVIAEIPPLPGGRRHREELMAETMPSDPFVESYRALRTVVLLASVDPTPFGTVTPASGNGANGAAQPDNGSRPRKVILITSPGAGEGKTTTTAHLGALLAEGARTVLVVSADFRRPRVHLYFGVDRSPGLSEVLTGQEGAPSLGGLRLKTHLKNVHLLASGAPIDNPAPFLARTVDLIRAARELFDFVVVDCAPMLIANDASELIAAADMVIVLGRAGRTSTEAAHRAAEILERIEAPVIGAVLIAADDTPTAYQYYRNRYYSASEHRAWWRRHQHTEDSEVIHTGAAVVVAGSEGGEEPHSRK